MNGNDVDIIRAYDSAMHTRAAAAAKRAEYTPPPTANPALGWIGKWPVDTELADGKKQRVFHPPTPVYALLAAKQSARAQLMQRRPEETRDFQDEI